MHGWCRTLRLEDLTMQLMHGWCRTLRFEDFTIQLMLEWCRTLCLEDLKQDPPPPPTTLIPHIEVGFKWMWTQLATPNKMAPVFVDLCAGLVVLLPRQIRRSRHGFFSSAVLDWSLRSCVRVRHLWRQQIERTIDGIFVDLSSPEHRHYEVESRCRSAGNATMVTSWRSSIKLFLWALPEWEIWTLKNPYRESHSLESDLYVRF